MSVKDINLGNKQVLQFTKITSLDNFLLMCPFALRSITVLAFNSVEVSDFRDNPPASMLRLRTQSDWLGK